MTHVNTPKHSRAEQPAATAYSALSLLVWREAGVLPERQAARLRVGASLLETLSDCPHLRLYQSFCPHAGQFQPLSHPVPIPAGGV